MKSSLFIIIIGLVMMHSLVCTGVLRAEEKVTKIDVAILAMREPQANPQILENVYLDAELAFSSYLKKEKKLVSLSMEDSEKTLMSEMPRVLQLENTQAMEFYYHFKFEEALHLLEDRNDEESLKMRALIADSQGNAAEAEDILSQLLFVNPSVKLSSKDFPPRLLALLEKVRKNQASPRPLSGIVKLGSLSLNERELSRWAPRFQTVMREKKWPELLIFRIEPIGWNYKLQAWLFSYKEGQETSVRTRAVEMVDIKNISKAVKLLMTALYSMPAPQAQVLMENH